MKLMHPDEKLKIIDELEELKVPFRHFWGLCDIYFTDNIPTACISFYKENIALQINKTFWDELPRKAQLFIICHEQEHLILDHFYRLKFSEGDARNKNIAADIVVNHKLIRNYDFEKTDLPKWEKYCWLDTVFPGKDVPDNKTAHFYYNLLNQKDETSGEDGQPSSGDAARDAVGDAFDSHEQGGEIPRQVMDKLKEIVSEYVKEQTAELSDDEKQQWIEDNCLDEHAEHDHNYDTTGFGNRTQTHHVKRTNDNIWKTLHSKMQPGLCKDKLHNHWIFRQRNHHLLPDDLMLPATHTIDIPKQVRVHVYMDTSGSCSSNALRFLKLAVTLPKKLFDIKMFGFGTTVYEVDLTPPYTLKGFGNESYQAVSNHVDEHGKNIDGVIVFTDGYSPQATITHPRKWHWLITPDGSTSTIDSKCNIYDLANFKWHG